MGSKKPFLCLLHFSMLQPFHNKGGRRNNCPGLAVFRRNKLVCFHVLILMKLHLLIDRQNTVIKIHTIPCQPENLTLTNSCKQSDNKEGFKAVPASFFYKRRNLCIITRCNLCLFNMWKNAGIRRIKPDISNQNSLLQYFTKNSMDIFDCLGGKPLWMLSRRPQKIDVSSLYRWSIQHI